MLQYITSSYNQQRGLKMEFKDKVKAVRKKLIMTQEQLAIALGCTRQTVNRWENGIKPQSFIMEAKFDKFCEENGITFDNEKFN